MALSKSLDNAIEHSVSIIPVHVLIMLISKIFAGWAILRWVVHKYRFESVGILPEYGGVV